VGRRPDGYHELESLFLPLDLADGIDLEVAPAPRSSVRLRVKDASAEVPTDSRNLAVRAAEGFLEAAGLQLTVDLCLRKAVPAAAGLGGGSSDAGAVLRGLSALYPDALDDPATRELALRLGADVPFFLDPRPALVSGVGEHCRALPAGWPAWTLVLVNPGAPLSTAEVFRRYAALVPDPGPGEGRFKERVWAAAADPAALPPLLQNDLERAAGGLCPAIGTLRERLLGLGARVVSLSGSGATVFGIFSDTASAEGAREALAGECWARVARTAESR